MVRILNISIVAVLLCGCVQTADWSVFSARPACLRAIQGPTVADYALAAAVRCAGGASYDARPQDVSEAVWSKLWDNAALSPALRTSTESLMQALLRKMEILTYNVSNAETVGFKRTRVFIEMQAAEGTSTGDERVTVHTEIVFDQGSALQAGNLDAMIAGDGFFRVKLPDGRIGYTRAGHFVRNAAGVITLGGIQGLPLADAVAISEVTPASDVSMGSNGEVSGLDEDGEIQILGQLRLARFPNPSGLRRHAASIFVSTDEAGAPIVDVPGENGLGAIIPGHLEMSNADFVTEANELATTRQRFDATLVLVRLAAAGPPADHGLAD